MTTRNRKIPATTEITDADLERVQGGLIIDMSDVLISSYQTGGSGADDRAVSASVKRLGR